MSLIDAPDCIDSVYTEGKSSSPRTLYELRSLHDDYPEEVQEWCEETDEITRKKVMELAGDLKNGTYKQHTESDEYDGEIDYIDTDTTLETESASKPSVDKITKPLLLLTIY